MSALDFIDPASIADRPQMTFQAYLFCHFDSRGGSTLIMADSVKKAIEHYAESFKFGDKADDHDFGAALMDLEFKHALDILVLDGDVHKDGGELLEAYGGEFKAARLFTRLRKWNGQGWFPWRPESLLVLYKGKRPLLRSAKGDYRLDLRKWDLGEDAYGIILDRA